MSDYNVQPFWIHDPEEQRVHEVMIALHNAFKFDVDLEAALTLLQHLYSWLKLPNYTFSITQQLGIMSFTLEGGFMSVSSTKPDGIILNIKVYQCGVPMCEGTGGTVMAALCDAWNNFFSLHSLDYVYHFLASAKDAKTLQAWLKQRCVEEMKLIHFSNSFFL